MEMEMETKATGIAKRVYHMVRVVFFMLRKGISKGKLMMDLNLFLKRRRKLAGKAIANLLLHHHHHHNHHTTTASSSYTASREYEFSCSNTPNYTFFLKGNKRNRNNNFFNFKCADAPATRDDDVATVNAVKAVMEVLNHNNNNEANNSPAVPGFGLSPMVVRQLRVTDSPFPIRDDEKDDQVDKAAEEFIKRFYKELRKQD